MRLGWLLLAALLPLAACSDDDVGALRVSATAFVGDPTDQPLYFPARLCVSGDDALVKITGVRGTSVEGAVEPVTFEIAFDDVQTETLVDQQPVPERFQPAVGAVGAVPSCDRAEARPATLAVVLPPAVDRPVVVDGLTVAYEIDGEEHTARGEALLVQCPPGTQAGGNDEHPCPPAR